MALTEIPSELSSSPSIVDNGNATAITIGSDESVALGGALTVDTNTLVVDATNNRVGVGTASPDTTLHLQTPSGTKSEINFAQTAVTNYRIGVPASTDALVFTYGASTERLRITSAGALELTGPGGMLSDS